MASNNPGGETSQFGSFPYDQCVDGLGSLNMRSVRYSPSMFVQLPRGGPVTEEESSTLAPVHRPTRRRKPKHRAASQHGTPQHGTPQYDTPQYDTPQYDTPQYDTPQYDTPQYDTPQYGTSQPASPDGHQNPSNAFDYSPFSQPTLDEYDSRRVASTKLKTDKGDRKKRKRNSEANRLGFAANAGNVMNPSLFDRLPDDDLATDSWNASRYLRSIPNSDFASSLLEAEKREEKRGVCETPENPHPYPVYAPKNTQPTDEDTYANDLYLYHEKFIDPPVGPYKITEDKVVRDRKIDILVLGERNCSSKNYVTRMEQILPTVVASSERTLEALDQRISYLSGEAGVGSFRWPSLEN